MGELADMILEGLLDEQTGEYIGDKNIKMYGEAAPGFPISYEKDTNELYHNEWFKKRPGKKLKKTDKCPHCGKLVAAGGLALQQHVKDKHPELPS